MYLYLAKLLGNLPKSFAIVYWLIATSNDIFVSFEVTLEEINTQQSVLSRCSNCNSRVTQPIRGPSLFSWPLTCLPRLCICVCVSQPLAVWYTKDIALWTPGFMHYGITAVSTTSTSSALLHIAVWLRTWGIWYLHLVLVKCFII